MPTYNRLDLLRVAVESVLNQTAKSAQVIIVIDEKEDREKYQFLDEYDGPIEYIFTGSGKGPGGGRNIGLDRATSDYVFFLDDDDSWLPTKSEKQLEVMMNEPDVVAVFCDYINVNRFGIDQEKVICKHEINECVMIHAYAGSPSFMGYRFNDKTRHLRFDESLPNYEDVEFFIRLWEFGSFHVVQERLARYNDHAGARISSSNDKSIRSMKMIMQKHEDKLTWGEKNWYRSKVYMHRCIHGNFFPIMYLNYYLHWILLRMTGKSSSVINDYNTYTKKLFKKKRRLIRKLKKERREAMTS